MARILVLGYGNPLRRDDGLGWQIAVQLFRANTSLEIEILPCHQLTPELADSVSHADAVFFIDSTRQGVPGEFRCVEIPPQTGPLPLTHDLSPAALLDLSSELFGSCPRAYLLTICGESFEAGESLSPIVVSRLPQLKAHLRELIEEELHKSLAAR